MALALFFYGLSFPVMKYALKETNWLTLLVFRFMFASAFLLLFAVRRRPGTWQALRRRPLLLWMGGCNFLGMALQMAGIAHTTATKSAVLTQLMVVATPFLAYFILGERFTLARFLAAIFSLSGALVLTTGLDFRDVWGRGTLLGDMLVVAAVLFWSLTTILMRKMAQAESPFPLLVANTTVTFLLGALIAPIIGCAPIGWTGLAAALFLAVFCTIVPTYLFIYALQAIDATTSAIVGPLEIVSALLVAFLFLGERMNTAELLGTGLILVSVYIVARPKVRKRSDG